jgi:threonine synthase
MGMPAQGFHAAVNANDSMVEYMNTGSYQPQISKATLSNAMDVGDPSNRPRLEWMHGFDTSRMQREFEVTSASDSATMDAMRAVWEQHHMLVCPHTAIGFDAAWKSPDTAHRVVLATAHPAKFGDAVEEATGKLPEVPPSLQGCLDKEKQATMLPADYGAFRSFLQES